MLTSPDEEQPSLGALVHKSDGQAGRRRSKIRTVRRLGRWRRTTPTKEVVSTVAAVTLLVVVLGVAVGYLMVR